jgi:hypothetical protein
MKVSRSVGITFRVEVEVDDPQDEDAVEDALAEAGQEAFRDTYGVEVPMKDIIIFDEGDYDAEE